MRAIVAAMQAALAAIVAAGLEYWGNAPELLHDLGTWLPVLMTIDAVASVAHRRICPDIKPPDVEHRRRGGTWQAVGARMVLTSGMFVMAVATDSVAGAPYSWAIMALTWGYVGHMGSALSHARCLALHYDIDMPDWLDALAQVPTAQPQREGDDSEETNDAA